MNVSAILLARVLGFFEIAALNPRNGLFFPDVTKELVQTFNFQTFPRTLEEWRDPNGSQFSSGKLGTVVIDKFVLFNNGIQVDTSTNTTESKRILLAILEWGKEKFGLSYSSGSIVRWGYVSNLVFASDVAILSTPPLENLSIRVSDALTDEGIGLGVRPLIYQPIFQAVGHDPLATKYGRAPFTIQRRLDVPFDDNKYFSEAPLPTDVHIELLRKFEQDCAAFPQTWVAK